MSDNMKLIDAIMNGDASASREAFSAAITDKVNTVLDIRRIEMASEVFNQVQEGTMKKEILNPNVIKNLPEDTDELSENNASSLYAMGDKVGFDKKHIDWLYTELKIKHKDDRLVKQAITDMIQSIAKFKKRFDENVEDTDQLDEKLIGQQKFDNAKVLAGAMSRDAYDKKYKLGKYQKR